MDKLERLTNAIDSALAAVSTEAPTSAVVRAALRVATLRQDAIAEWWLSKEIEGIGTRAENLARNNTLLTRLTALVGASQARQLHEKAFDAYTERRRVHFGGEERFLSHSVATLEAHKAAMREIIDEPIAPGLSANEAAAAHRDKAAAKAKLYGTLLEQTTVLERIRDVAYMYVVDAEAQLLSGDPIPDAVARGRAFVVDELAKRAPKALDALQSAESRAVANDQESLSLAATSCRRAIKAIADALFPAGDPVLDDLGVQRVLDDEHYRNRLVEYVRSAKGKSTHADVLASNIVSLGTRLKTLDDLSSKGVHGDLSREEIETCLTWLYMLAADLLRIETQLSISLSIDAVPSDGFAEQ